MREEEISLSRRGKRKIRQAGWRKGQHLRKKKEKIQIEEGLARWTTWHKRGKGP